jgi:AcrR family transcriptional regulator
VIDVALLSIIRRWHIRDQVPIREVARRLGISRNTVRRYLRSEIIEPSYADRHTPSCLDKFAFKLSAWLKTEAAKSRKQRRSLRQIHLDLCSLGFEGSYDRVAAFARKWRVDQLARVNSASKGTTRASRSSSPCYGDVFRTGFSNRTAIHGDGKRPCFPVDRQFRGFLRCNNKQPGRKRWAR